MSSGVHRCVRCIGTSVMEAQWGTALVRRFWPAEAEQDEQHVAPKKGGAARAPCRLPVLFGLLRDCARCLSTSCSRVVDRRFYAADESCSDRRWLLAFGCVARYYFLATFEARRWRSSPSVGRLMVFQDFLDFLVFLETSEVAGPGPNPREIDISFGAQWPLACVRGPWARQEHLLPAALR